MEKNVEYYLGLPYTRELIPEPSGVWFVRIKELPNCMSQGNTPEEALHNIQDALQGWLEGELEDGDLIPEPRDEEEYSGKFNTRVSRSLHRKLVETASSEGVSLNQWINTTLAESVGSYATHTTAKTPKNEDAPSESHWPGLTEAAKNVLGDIGLGREAGVIDERLFASWLEQNIDDINAEYRRGDYEQSLNKAKALADLLLQYQKHSHVLRSIYHLIVHQIALVEQLKEEAVK